MIRISTSKIGDIVQEADGLVIDGVQYTLNSGPQGIAAVFSTDAGDEEVAMASLKKHLKAKFPVLILYVELV